MLRRILFGLLFTFLLLLIAFALLIGASSLAQVAGDQPAHAVLWWIAMSALLLAAVDLVALVITLALLSLGSVPSRGEESQD